jgi:hypothetical protein
VRLADIDVDELVKALHMERSTWIKAPKEQGRRETDAEKLTICRKKKPNAKQWRAILLSSKKT